LLLLSLLLLFRLLLLVIVEDKLENCSLVFLGHQRKINFLPDELSGDLVPFLVDDGALDLGLMMIQLGRDYIIELWNVEHDVAPGFGSIGVWLFGSVGELFVEGKKRERDREATG